MSEEKVHALLKRVKDERLRPELFQHGNCCAYRDGIRKAMDIMRDEIEKLEHGKTKTSEEEK